MRPLVKDVLCLVLFLFPQRQIQEGGAVCPPHVAEHEEVLAVALVDIYVRVAQPNLQVLEKYFFHLGSLEGPHTTFGIAAPLADDPATGKQAVLALPGKI